MVLPHLIYGAAQEPKEVNGNIMTKALRLCSCHCGVDLARDRQISRAQSL